MSASEIGDLWPAEVHSQVYFTPAELLQEQAVHLTERTNGLLRGRVARDEAKIDGEGTRITLRFEVESPRLSKTVKLFEASHRAEVVYPVALVPPGDDLPAYLRRKQYVPGMVDYRSLVDLTSKALSEVITQKGHWVENNWIASTPSEFVAKVKEILSMVTVKAAVVSLLSRSEVSRPEEMIAESPEQMSPSE